MAAALRAWGISQNLFQLGFAKESDDAQVIAAAMAQPGLVLKRPVGSNKHFQQNAELPTADSLSKHWPRIEVPRDTVKQSLSKKADKKAKHKVVATSEKEERKAAAAVEKEERKAAAAFEKEERKRELQRRKEKAAAARAQARRHAAIEHANSALEEARRQHDETVASIEKQRQEVERLAEAEEIRWQKLRSGLEAALQKAKR